MRVNHLAFVDDVALVLSCPIAMKRLLYELECGMQEVIVIACVIDDKMATQIMCSSSGVIVSRMIVVMRFCTSLNDNIYAQLSACVR